jgi:putative hydrolases of HD superfamily
MSELMGFIHAAERLKTELRRAHKSSGAQESVAEHSWRLCLMTLALSRTIEGMEGDKCLRMALIHDLPEIYAGDVSRLDLPAHAERHDREQAALERLNTMVAPDVAEELSRLWSEFEEGNSAEARLVRLLDRLEVLIQHNESDIATWSDLEKEIQYGLAEKHAERYGFLKELALEIDEETRLKLERAGIRPRKVEQETYSRYYG